MAATTAAVVAIAGAASSAYGASQQNKQAKRAAKAANQPQTSYSVRTPYMNEYISQIAPYIMESAQQVYGNRMKGYGLPALDFSKVQERLSNISPNYAGVGGSMDAGGALAGGGRPQGLEYDLARLDRQRRGAWERNTPTDLNLGADQIEGPVMQSMDGMPTMGSGSEMANFSVRNAEAGNQRETYRNLNEARNEALYGLAMDRPAGIDIHMPELPQWLRRKNRKNKGSSAGFTLGLQ